MSLEELIKEHTAALVANTAELKALRERMGLNAAAALVQATPTESKPKAEAEKPEPEAPKVTREQVVAACKELQAQDGTADRAKAILAQLGVSKVPLLAEDQYPEALKLFNDAIASPLPKDDDLAGA